MKAKFRLLSLILIFSVNILVGILFWVLFFKKAFSSSNLNNQSFIISTITIITLAIVALYLLFQLKHIQVEKDKIIFKNILFPFLKKERLFSFYDYSKTVEKITKFGDYETLWLIKNNKLEDEIYSFNYSNYTKLKFEIKVTYKGSLRLGIFRQTLCKMGIKFPQKSA